MTRFPASGGGSGPPYTYVQDGFPDGAKEGESLYHITNNAAYVFSGVDWIEQTVTNHSQLAGISEGDHRSDQRVSDLAPVQSVNGNTGDVTAVPSGVITMWSGSPSNVPSGWTLCDGSDGTPDLRNRFIVGAGGSYNAGDTGGSASVTLSVSEMPAHSHDYSRYAGAKQYNTAGSTEYGDNTENYGSNTTSEAGSGNAHENRPPYYALAFIMKT